MSNGNPLVLLAALLSLGAGVAAAETSVRMHYEGNDGGLFVHDSAENTQAELIARGDRIRGELHTLSDGSRTRVTAEGDDMRFRVFVHEGDFDGMVIPCRPGAGRPDVEAWGDYSFDAIGCN